MQTLDLVSAFRVAPVSLWCGDFLIFWYCGRLLISLFLVSAMDSAISSGILAFLSKILSNNSAKNQDLGPGELAATVLLLDPLRAKEYGCVYYNYFSIPVLSDMVHSSLPSLLLFNFLLWPWQTWLLPELSTIYWLFYYTCKVVPLGNRFTN